MKEKELYAWIRLILIEAGYEEDDTCGQAIFIRWDPTEYLSWDIIYNTHIIAWIKENK